MGSYRLDGVKRKAVAINLSVTSKYIFDNNSKQSLSEFVEDKILEEFDGEDKLKSRRYELMKEIKQVNQKLKNFDANKKLNETIKKTKDKLSCALCGMESKVLINLKKQKAKICKNCYKSTSASDIARILKK